MGVEEAAKLFQGSSAEQNWELIEHKDEGEDEEFYEKIEAPKFVDFTLPNHYGPDDRYWFCLRVGCEQKHEKEMDSEEIYKKFVLRVMAARSPNVIHKALGRNASSKNVKCPLSAPAKPSKSVLPRFAIVSSKRNRNGEDIVKAKPPGAKVCSTPKAKGKQVSSKYLTTPSYKKCQPNPTSFQSVGGKPPTPVLPAKSRIVAKALKFHSPIKEQVKLKELNTPTVEKLCQGLKNLEITSPSMRMLGYSSKTSSKPVGNNPQKPRTRGKVDKLENSTSKMSSSVVQPPHTHNAKSSRSIKHMNQDKLSNLQGGVPQMIHQVLLSKSTTGGNDENVTASESCRHHSSCIEAVKDASEAPTPQVSYEEKEAGCKSSAVTQIDDKENVDDYSNLTGRGEVLGNGMHNSAEGKKDTLNVNKKGSAAAGMRMMKPKLTNPKPFRLRTDERGILKETKIDVVRVPPSLLSRRKDGDIQKKRRCTRAKTPEPEVPTSLKGHHSSKLKDVTSSTHQRQHLKNILRKSTVSSRMHAMASKMTPVSSAGKSIRPERKFNTDRNTKA